eukprot:12891431-Heterocapsa_arctica.AAC.2
MAEAVYTPRLVAHLPGVANDLADDLSRLSEPFARKSIPLALQTVTRTFCRDRDLSYYRTLAEATASL